MNECMNFDLPLNEKNNIISPILLMSKPRLKVVKQFAQVIKLRSAWARIQTKAVYNSRLEFLFVCKGPGILDQARTMPYSAMALKLSCA